jgi:hypothetical protein
MCNHAIQPPNRDRHPGVYARQHPRRSKVSPTRGYAARRSGDVMRSEMRDRLESLTDRLEFLL